MRNSSRNPGSRFCVSPASRVSGSDPVHGLPQTCSPRYRSIRLNCLQIQPHTALFLTFIHLTLTITYDITVIICGD